MELQIAFLSWHAMTKLHVVKKNIKFFFPLYFVYKKVLMPLPWCARYTFVNYICTRYVNAHIHQTLNPRPHESTLRFWPPNHFKNLLTKEKKFNFIMFGMKLFRKFKFEHKFFFSKFISNATNENMILKQDYSKNNYNL
jgi:hypothetical protein